MLSFVNHIPLTEFTPLQPVPNQSISQMLFYSQVQVQENRKSCHIQPLILKHFPVLFRLASRHRDSHTAADSIKDSAAQCRYIVVNSINPNTFLLLCDSPYYPNATSRTIISENPTAKKIVPIFECSPTDISGISSSTTT